MGDECERKARCWILFESNEGSAITVCIVIFPLGVIAVWQDAQNFRGNLDF